MQGAHRRLQPGRVNAGIAAAKARGVRMGRPPRMHLHTATIMAMVAEVVTAAEASRRLRLPYSSVAEAMRELRGGPKPGSADGLENIER